MASARPGTAAACAGVKALAPTRTLFQPIFDPFTSRVSVGVLVFM
jgi:hypothetical protein